MFIPEKKETIVVNWRRKSKQNPSPTYFYGEKIDRRILNTYNFTLFGSEYFFQQSQITPTKLEEHLTWFATKTGKSRVMSETIYPEQHLCVTLCYLISGEAHVTIAAN